MADASTAADMVPENLSIKSSANGEPASAKPPTGNQPTPFKPQTCKETASDKPHNATLDKLNDDSAPVAPHTHDVLALVKPHARSEPVLERYDEQAPLDLQTHNVPVKPHARNEPALDKYNEPVPLDLHTHKVPALVTPPAPAIAKSYTHNEPLPLDLHTLKMVATAPAHNEPAVDKSHAPNERAPVNPNSGCNKVGVEVQTTNEPFPGEVQIKKEQSHSESLWSSSDAIMPVKVEPKEEEQEVKEEVHGSASTMTDRTSLLAEENPLVGKLKIKPMASLVESIQPNPRPGLHPFFAGFDEHIRSLILNRQPQFAMNSPLVQRSPQFMYYDNSTNLNLKKMLNGHKMAQVTPSRHPTFRPYVPINVPRPPRSQPFRNSFSTQTPPVFMSQADVAATPSTSFVPARPPLPNFTPQKTQTPQNLTSLKNISVPSFTPTNIIQKPKIFPSSTTFESNLTPRSTLNFPPVRNLTVPPVFPTANKVSTSSSTDDLEKHSSETVIIKTEVDLDVDSKEELQATLNECTEIEPHFMDVDSAKTSCSVPPKLEMSDDKPQNPILTGDDVTPPVKDVKLNPLYSLPAYSTKGLLLCKCCDFRCNKKKKMKEHMDTMHTAENHFKCFYCVKKLLPVLLPHKTVHDLEHHVAKVHRGEKRWQCKFCSKTYKCQASYKSHIEKTCSQSHPYACHMCTFTCVTEAQLEKHIRSHQKNQETQECPFCRKTFKKFYMKQHLLSVHAPPEEKPFHCVSCDFAAAAMSTLENHYRRTGHDKQFKCNQCDYACRNKSILKNHIEFVHQKEEPDKFVCGIDGCKVRLPHERSLRVHRQIHSMPDSELFICPEKTCMKKFTTRQSLRYHTTKTKHHKPFKCSDCTHRFLKEESLNKHIQTVHVVKILKDMEKSQTPEKVCVKNVVDVFNYVESGGATSVDSGEEALPNFGCWLGISGFGDIDKTDCDNQAEMDISESKKEETKKMVEEEDDDYRNLVPITCLVELKQEEAEDALNDSPRKSDAGVTVFLKKEDEEEEDDDDDDTEYHHINPEISCLVECQQNATVDSSTNCSDADYLPGDIVKVEVEEGDAS